MLHFPQSMKTHPTLSTTYSRGNKCDETTDVAYSYFIQTSCLKLDNTNVQPFVGDGHRYRAEVCNGRKKTRRSTAMKNKL